MKEGFYFLLKFLIALQFDKSYYRELSSKFHARVTQQYYFKGFIRIPGVSQIKFTTISFKFFEIYLFKKLLFKFYVLIEHFLFVFVDSFDDFSRST